MYMHICNLRYFIIYKCVCVLRERVFLREWALGPGWGLNPDLLDVKPNLDVPQFPKSEKKR